jgi:hypothetical protein
MKNTTAFSAIFYFVKNNWFRLCITALMLVAWFRNDLGQFARSEGHRHRMEQPAPKLREKYTEAEALATSLSPTTGRMKVPSTQFSPFGNGGLSELPGIDEDKAHAYLARFAKVAREEEKRFGVPASVILAVSLYQSAAGQRDLALDVNNHFAMPCSTDWNGPCREFQGRAYRKYSSAWASFRDFSLFAKQNYARLSGAKPVAWALALEADGFGETNDFAKEIMELVEQFGLD